MSKKELVIMIVLAVVFVMSASVFPEVGWVVVLSFMILGPIALVLMLVRDLFRKKEREN